MNLQELVKQRSKASDRAIYGLTDVLRQLQPSCEAAQHAKIQQSLQPLTRLGPEENRIAIKCLCKGLDPVQSKQVDEGFKLEQSSIKLETNIDSAKATVCSGHITDSKPALPSDGAHMLHVSMEDAMWDQMDPASVRLGYGWLDVFGLTGWLNRFMTAIVMFLGG